MYAAGPRLRVSKGGVRKWLAGEACPHEWAYRALMTLIDEGRA
jgi:DNA-binding transcriptional regulator YiaG